MLVMSRKPGERIVIDNSIVITVLHTARGRVRLGIDAPPTVAIQRTELLEAETKRTSGRNLVAAQPPAGPAE
jgi:carbon storage regulator